MAGVLSLAAADQRLPALPGSAGFKSWDIHSSRSSRQIPLVGGLGTPLPPGQPTDLFEIIPVSNVQESVAGPVKLRLRNRILRLMGVLRHELFCCKTRFSLDELQA